MEKLPISVQIKYPVSASTSHTDYYVDLFNLRDKLSLASYYKMYLDSFVITSEGADPYYKRINNTLITGWYEIHLPDFGYPNKVSTDSPSPAFIISNGSSGNADSINEYHESQPVVISGGFHSNRLHIIIKDQNGAVITAKAGHSHIINLTFIPVF